MSDFTNLSEISWIRLLALVLPGFISIRVYSLIHPSENKPLKDILLDAIAYSVLNAALLWFLVQDYLLVSTPLLSWPVMVLVFVLAPAGWPFLLNRLLISLAHRNIVLFRHRTGWDDFFSRRNPCWLRVHLHDGTVIAGYFGERSYATLFPQSGHLYMEQLWNVDAGTGEIQGEEPISAGIILKPDDYRFVEVAKIEERARDRKQWWKAWL